MKKLSYLIVLAVILSLVLTGCTLLSNVGQVPTTGQSGMTYLIKNSNGGLYTEENPFTTDLIAGQNTDVGEVQVWNDAEYLHITYVIDALGWYLTETHLHVACDESAIPQNKKGNPIPGHFDYSSEHEFSEEVTEEPFVISLDDIGCCNPVIAAHAVVMRLVPDCWETVWQIGDVETLDCAEGTQLTNYADEFNWELPAGPCTAGPSLKERMPEFANPFVIGTNSDSEFPYNSNASTTYSYATNFDVQWDGELPFGGKLLVSWSPGQSATEIKVVSDGFGTTTITAIGTPTAGGFLNKYPLVQHSITVGQLSLGTHTINFQHTQGDGTFWDWIRLEKPCEQWETAWGYGDRFVVQGNWATYFIYEIQPVLVDTVQVEPYGTNPYIYDSTNSIDLPAGNYRLVASGTYRFANWVGTYGTADALCNRRTLSYASGTLVGDDWYILDNNRLQVFVFGGAVDWKDVETETLRTLDPNHTYSYEFSHTGGTIEFGIEDNNYDDNDGFITVEIYLLPCND